MIYNLILLVPAGLDITEKDNDGNYLIGSDAIAAISELFAKWPFSLAVGTHSVNGQQLNHTQIMVQSDDIITMLESLIISYELPWKLMAVQSFFEVNQTEELPDGTIRAFQAPIQYMPVDQDIYQYITLEEGESPTISMIGNYAGASEWVDDESIIWVDYGI